MIQPIPPPKPPPFNDQLYQALSPLKKVVDDAQRIKMLERKYGVTPAKERPIAPPIQWEGDPNG